MEKITFEEWCESNNLDSHQNEYGLYSIEGDESSFFFIDYKEKIFDKDMNLCLSEEELGYVIELLNNGFKFNLCFQFGDSLYYTKVIIEKDDFNESIFKVEPKDLLYIGKSKNIGLENYLGVHTEYEMLNVACRYEEVVKKAKFIGAKTLAMCDRNTLAGTLAFQLKCKDYNIKSILGETVSVVYRIDYSQKQQETYDIKLYVINEYGWDNLLRINTIINVDNLGKFIKFEDLIKYGKGLIAVFDYSDSYLYSLKGEEQVKQHLELMFSKFDYVYHQFSSVVYNDNNIDFQTLESFKRINSYNLLDIILIDDIFYLEKSHADCKDLLNKLGGSINPYSENRYFKTLKDVKEELTEIFSDISLLECWIDNIKLISEKCDYKIPVNDPKLPKYEIDGVELSREESEELLRHFIEEGFEEKVVNAGLDVKLYRERTEYEFSVIKDAQICDYFLILIDLCKSAKEIGSMVGPGRGSASGSLIAYLTEITYTDPIKYDLLFERFLNKARFTETYNMSFELDNGEKIVIEEEKMVTLKGGKEKMAKDIIEGDEIILEKLIE